MVNQSRLYWYQRELANLGVVGTLGLKVSRARGASLPVGTPVRIRARLAEHPMWFRAGTSDLTVFHEMFVARDYSCLDSVRHAELIVDCGANVGYAAVYFLNRYPNAHLIAIEPDPGNFELLTRNLASYADRCTLIRAGVWPTAANLHVSDVATGAGGEWGITVRECLPGEPASCEAIDIGSVLAQSGQARISILKIDIEGSEAEVFARNVDPWIHKFDNLVIELHDELCEATVHGALADQALDISRLDTLTLFRRRE